MGGSKLGHFRLRPLAADDHDAVAAIGNATWPDHRVTGAELAARDRRVGITRPVRRVVATQQGRIVGWSLAEGEVQVADPAHYRVSLAVDPAVRGQGIGGALAGELADWLASQRARSVVTDVAEDHAAARRFVEHRGFEIALRLSVCALDVQAFDPAAHAATLARVAAAGVDIAPFPALRAQDPQALERLHALRGALSRDVPGTEAHTVEPLASLAAYFEASPSARPGSWMVARQGEAYVGLTSCWGSHGQPDRLHTGLTGVLPCVRRQGVATALKVAAIGYAQRAGVRVLDTENEESNPMYRLNLALGFVPRPAWLVYRRTLPR